MFNLENSIIESTLKCQIILTAEDNLHFIRVLRNLLEKLIKVQLIKKR